MAYAVVKAIKVVVIHFPFPHPTLNTVTGSTPKNTNTNGNIH